MAEFCWRRRYAHMQNLEKKFGFQEEGRRIREYRLADGSYRDDILMSAWVG